MTEQRVETCALEVLNSRSSNVRGVQTRLTDRTLASDGVTHFRTSAIDGTRSYGGP